MSDNWVLKDVEDGTYFHANWAWSSNRAMAVRFGSVERARQFLCKGGFIYSVRVVRLVQKGSRTKLTELAALRRLRDAVVATMADEDSDPRASAWATIQAALDAVPS